MAGEPVDRTAGHLLERPTTLVKDIWPRDSSGLNSLEGHRGRLFFGAYKRNTGYELWRSDGTASGTVLVKDINPGERSSVTGR